MKIVNLLLLKIQWVFIAHNSYPLVERRIEKLYFPDSIKHFLCAQERKYMWVIKRKKIFDLSESCGPTLGLTRLSKPHVFGLSVWLHLRMFGLTTRQTWIYMDSTLGWAQGCWVWQLARPIYIWAKRLAKPKAVGFSSLSYTYTLELNT